MFSIIFRLWVKSTFFSLYVLNLHCLMKCELFLSRVYATFFKSFFVENSEHFSKSATIFTHLCAQYSRRNLGKFSHFLRIFPLNLSRNLFNFLGVFFTFLEKHCSAVIGHGGHLDHSVRPIKSAKIS